MGHVRFTFPRLKVLACGGGAGSTFTARYNASNVTWKLDGGVATRLHSAHARLNSSESIYLRTTPYHSAASSHALQRARAGIWTRRNRFRGNLTATEPFPFALDSNISNVAYCGHFTHLFNSLPDGLSTFKETSRRLEVPTKFPGYVGSRLHASRS